MLRNIGLSLAVIVGPAAVAGVISARGRRGIVIVAIGVRAGRRAPRGAPDRTGTGRSRRLTGEPTTARIASSAAGPGRAPPRPAVGSDRMRGHRPRHSRARAENMPSLTAREGRPTRSATQEHRPGRLSHRGRGAGGLACTPSRRSPAGGLDRVVYAVSPKTSARSTSPPAHSGAQQPRVPTSEPLSWPDGRRSMPQNGLAAPAHHSKRSTPAGVVRGCRGWEFRLRTAFAGEQRAGGVPRVVPWR